MPRSCASARGHFFGGLLFRAAGLAGFLTSGPSSARDLQSTPKASANCTALRSVGSRLPCS
jgi:hypothetical protein